MVYITAWATGFDPYLLWTRGLPLVTQEVLERGSSAHPKPGAPRRVRRRSNGNSLPLIGLRPPMKFKR